MIEKEAMYKLTYGLFVLTTTDGEKQNGCIVNTVSMLTDNPKRIQIAVNKANFTHDMIKRTGMFNVSVLTEDVPFETIRHFGMQTGREVDKFEHYVGFDRSANGLIYLTDHANAMFSCKVLSKQDLGSHMMFIGEVTEAKVLSKEPSCTYAHYHKAIKPKF